MSQRCLGCMELFEDELQVCPSCGYVVGTEVEEAIHMAPGTMLRDRYLIGKVLGYGGFGVTYIGWDTVLELKVAIKEYLPNEFSTRLPGQTQVTVFNGEKTEQFFDGMTKFVEEAKHLAKFQNEEGIVRVYDSFMENETAYIIMEYLDGETMTDYLKQVGTVTEEDALQMLTPIMDSLSVVHAEGILHRDIAPDNIYITKTGQIKLIDFGASRYATTSHSRSLTVIIKQGYSPEEQYRSRGDQGPYTDVYAVAATLYKMLTGKTPPDAMERRAMYESKNKDILIPPRKLNKKISRNTENAILNAMNVRIEDRTPDIASFKGELLSEEPVKRVYGKIKKIDLYGWPLWLKAVLATVMVGAVTLVSLLATGVIQFDTYSDEVVMPEGVTVVPDVEGISKSEAIEEVEAQELYPMIAGTIESEYIPAGLIIVQDPVGGTYAEKGGTVHLTVCSGKATVEAVDGVATVPYVEGDTEENARLKLETAGLGEPIVRYENSETVMEGHVISQSILAGTEVEEGTVLELTVSLGAADFNMPDVVGMNEDAAYSLLTGRGLVVRREYVKDENVPDNSVVRQDIPQGTKVKRGDTVTIVVSSGKKTVSVPNVVGMTKEEATSALKDEKLKVTVLENYDSKVEAGHVISQTPAAGSSQLTGSTVTIYVSKGKQPVSISFSGNGGSAGSGSKTVYYGDTYGDLPGASRTGYTFVGWFTGASDGSQVTSSTPVSSTSSHALYAHWSPNSYTVILDANTGSVSPGSISVTYDSTYSGLPTPQKEGHSFTGWFTAPSGGSQISSGTKVTITSTQTLYAQWSVNSYTLTVNGILDGVQSGSTDGFGTFDVTVGGAVVANDVTSYNGSIPYGTSYSISDVKAATGRNYDGIAAGAASGTMGLGQTVSLQFSSQSFTYTVHEISTNGTQLGSRTITGKYGSSQKVTSNYHNGYNYPSPRDQTVVFDTPEDKAIVFMYSPASYSSSSIQLSVAGSTAFWSISTEYTNRTASTIQIRIYVNASDSSGDPPYALWFSCSGEISVGATQLCSYGAGSGAYSSDWITVPAEATKASVSTTVTVWVTDEEGTNCGSNSAGLSQTIPGY